MPPRPNAMPIEFSSLLRAEGINPGDVRLLRHYNVVGRTPYAAWFADPPAFEAWQALQKASQAAHFASPIWASFVATPEGRTLFVGLYAASNVRPAPATFPDHLRGGLSNGSGVNEYSLSPMKPLADLGGRLLVEWPSGRNWRRLGSGKGYYVTEIKAPGGEPPYPGHSTFLEPLSSIEALPPGWKAILRTARGIYSLTCPRDKVHYVGKADGVDGFLGRWLQHAIAGGDAIAFRNREPSDYLVGILEVAGSFATARDIERMELQWMRKLQSRSIGLN